MRARDGRAAWQAAIEETAASSEGGRADRPGRACRRGDGERHPQGGFGTRGKRLMAMSRPQGSGPMRGRAPRIIGGPNGTASLLLFVHGDAMFSLFGFRKSGRRGTPSGLLRRGKSTRLIDVGGMIRQASIKVSVHQLLRKRESATSSSCPANASRSSSTGRSGRSSTSTGRRTCPTSPPSRLRRRRGPSSRSCSSNYQAMARAKRDIEESRKLLG